MKKIMTLLLISTSFYFCFTTEPQNIHLQFSTVFNLGIIEKNMPVISEIPLTNPNNQSIELRTVSSCSCLEIEKTSLTIPPQSSVFLPITFYPDGYSGNSTFIITLIYNGKQEKLPVVCIVNSPLSKKKHKKKISQQINYTEDESTLNQPNALCYFSYRNCSSCQKLIAAIQKAYPDTQLYFFALESSANNKLFFEKIYSSNFNRLPILYSNKKNSFYSGEEEIYNFLNGKEKISRRTSSMNTVAIFLSGLLDGINPCAFTVIILLLSYMTLNFRKRTEILIAGIFYIASVLITYFLVGLGLFEFIRRLEHFVLFKNIFKYGLSLFLAVLAGISLFDAVQCAKGKRENMVLKLPSVLQKTIRENIRNEMKNYRIFLSSILLGFLVSLLELACTGQVYLPIIGYMVRSTPWKGITYLLLYNIGFILPLATVFILVYSKISSKKIGDFFSNHLLFVKLAFCILFLTFFFANLFI